MIDVSKACHYNDQVLYCCQGDFTTPSSLVLVDPSKRTSKIIVNNYYGREFNSINDVVIHHARDEIWFTEWVCSGNEQLIDTNHFISAVLRTGLSKRSVHRQSFQVRYIDSSRRQVRSGVLQTDSSNAMDFALARTTRKCEPL